VNTNGGGSYDETEDELFCLGILFSASALSFCFSFNISARVFDDVDERITVLLSLGGFDEL